MQDLPVLGDKSTVCTLECALLYRAVACHTPEEELISIATHLVLKGQYHKVTIEIGEGVKKNRIYLGLCPKLWVGGSRSRSKVPNFLVKISIQLFLLQTSRNVLKHVIHKWGGHIWPLHDALRPQRFWNFGILSEKFLIFSKK